MTIDIPGLNVDAGLELCGGSTDIFLNSMRLYVTNMPAALKKMKNLSKETLKDYAIAVHGVKGISEYIGAEEAMKTAKQLETMAKADDFAGVQAQNDAFIKYAENLVDTIQKWLAKNGK